MEIAHDVLSECRELDGVRPVTAFTYWLYGGQRYPMAEGYCNSSSKSQAALLQATNDTVKTLGADICPSWGTQKRCFVETFVSTNNLEKTCLNPVEKKKSQKYSLESLPYYLS